MSATASVGKLLSEAPAYLRPPGARELAAYRLELGGKRIADIGAGDGRLTLAASRRAASVLGIDPDREALARGRAAARRDGLRNVTFREGHAQSLELPDASFDVVLFSWTL